ncbi:MAG TPA: type II secretion system protein [Cellvibrio sp.]|nr:type II secretion system protein [Cellvibrio sp.]
MTKQQSGFTLIELIVVIVILGILAAIAIPRFANFSTDARIAVVNSMAGTLRSAVAVSQSRYLATGNNSSTEVLLQGQTTGNGVVVAAGTGIPAGSANGIGRALSDTSGFTADFTTSTAVTFTPTGATNCNASYNGSTGIVTVTTTGC